METRKLFLGLAALAVMAAPVVAGPSLGDSGGPIKASGTGGFPWAPVNVTGDLGSFQTFCVEWDRAIKPGQDYWWTIDEEVKFGGNASVLTDETKKIFRAWQLGSLDGEFTASQIQEAIWKAEGAPDTFSLVGNTYNIDPDGHGIMSWLDNENNPDLYRGWTGVYVLNLWTQDGVYDANTDAQSVLIYVPTPGAILLGGIGTSIVGLLRRRKVM